MKNKLLLSLAGLFLVFGSCLDKSYSQNRLLPLDYSKEDQASREIWKTFKGEIKPKFQSSNCWFLFRGKYQHSKKSLYLYDNRIRPTFLRNGNLLFTLTGSEPNYSKTSGSLEFFDLKGVPPSSLVSVTGLDGLTFGPKIIIEVTQQIKDVVITYSHKVRRTVRSCSLKGPIQYSMYGLGRYIKKEATYQKAKARALKRSNILNRKFAPVIAKRPKEKVQPTIKLENYPPITDNYRTFIRGLVSDNAGVMTLLVNGDRAGIRADGYFSAKVKLKLGPNLIKLVAEDINGNVTTKDIKIVRQEYVPQHKMADVDIPPKTKMDNPDGIAVVVGIENYQYVSDATHAYNDAEVFREYLASTLGYRKSRVKIVSNSKATLAEMNKLLGPNGWLARNVKENASDVVVYFSGHGIPDAKTKKTGLLPHDVDPNYSIGLPLKGLYRTLGDMKARSVTVFLDTCFSGQGREKQTLLADKRGIMIVPLERSIPKSVSVLSAAASGQVSGPLKDKEHGLFTYYLLKGLGGAGDTNKDRQLSLSELGTYIRNQVKSAAASAGWNQTPEFQGDGSRMLVRYATTGMISVTKDAEEEIPGD